MILLEDIPDDDDDKPSKADDDVKAIESASAAPSGKTITDKEFYKAMQKLKDRGNNAVPPKKSASAYILFGKEVSDIFLL
jgi:hypothetical protein